MRKQLRPHAVPWLFAWTTENKYARARTERQRRRHSALTSSLLSAKLQSTQVQNAVLEDDIGAQETIASLSCDEDKSLLNDTTLPKEPNCISTSTQTAEEPPFNVDSFAFDDAGMHYYTGLESYHKLMYVLATLGHSAYCLTYYTHRCEYVYSKSVFLDSH